LADAKGISMKEFTKWLHQWSPTSEKYNQNIMLKVRFQVEAFRIEKRVQI